MNDFFGGNFQCLKSFYNIFHQREFEKELEDMEKDLANYKVQVEVKESSYMQALLNIEHYQQIIVELSTLLKNSEGERDRYLYECREATNHIDELKSKMKDMDDQLSESAKIRQQLSHVLHELKAAQGELLSMETEISVVRSSKLEAMTQAELMDTAVKMEKEKTEELLKHVLELNEVIYLSKVAAIAVEKEKCKVLSEKEVELQLAKEMAVQAQQQLEDITKQLETMQELENQLLEKSIFIDYLQLELEQAHELSSSSSEASSNAVNELNQLKTNIELQESKNSEQLIFIESLQMELDHLKLEVKNANEEVGRLNLTIVKLTSGLQEAQNEVNETKERENEAQVEIALLKSELHKGRSKIAAAEAAEGRANSVKAGLYLAVQQLAVEAEEAKKENQRFKEGANKNSDENGDEVFVNSQFENSFQEVELSQVIVSKTEAEETIDDMEAHITISMKDYESLVKKAEKADQLPASLPEDLSLLPTSDNTTELKVLKKELEAATVKISEFRTRAEQAVSRAEAAEKAKAIVEDQLRRWREQKQKRMAAFAALREETTPRESSPPRYESTPTYQPLGKVLNMKF